jgi:hypothetical protein
VRAKRPRPWHSFPNLCVTPPRPAIGHIATPLDTSPAGRQAYATVPCGSHPSSFPLSPFASLGRRPRENRGRRPTPNGTAPYSRLGFGNGSWVRSGSAGGVAGGASTMGLTPHARLCEAAPHRRPQAGPGERPSVSWLVEAFNPRPTPPSAHAPGQHVPGRGSLPKFQGGRVVAQVRQFVREASFPHHAPHHPPAHRHRTTNSPSCLSNVTSIHRPEAMCQASWDLSNGEAPGRDLWTKGLHFFSPGPHTLCYNSERLPPNAAACASATDRTPCCKPDPPARSGLANLRVRNEET